MSEEPRDIRTIVIEAGSRVAAERMVSMELSVDEHNARMLVSDYVQQIITEAPRALRSSFDACCAWARWNEVYQKASRANDYKTMMRAQHGIDDIMKAVH